MLLARRTAAGRRSHPAPLWSPRACALAHWGRPPRSQAASISAHLLCDPSPEVQGLAPRAVSGADSAERPRVQQQQEPPGGACSELAVADEVRLTVRERGVC